MTFPTKDYLQKPPHLTSERQGTREDVDFASRMMMQELLSQIRDELVRQNPTVLCQTDVQGGPTLTTINEDRTVKFLSGGKPVTVYKVLLWTQSAIAVRASVTGMSAGADGFQIPGTLLVLEVPVTELSIALNAAGTVGINVPSSLNANGSVFIYGFTNPHYYNKEY